jgi:arylsulfatase A
MNKLLMPMLALSALTSCIQQKKQTVETPQKPNIVIIYVDDLGYADVGCYGAKGVQTPNIDELAAKGVRFTDAHCSAATCTPSRYSILTGSYAFRNNAAILPGDAPLLIRPEMGTLPGMLQKAGYKTGVVGKWHLGLGNGFVDWNTEIKPGPLEVGFDYSFLIPATGDRVPTVFVENHRVVGLDPSDPIKISYKERIGNDPIGLEHPEMLKMLADEQHSQTIVNGVSRIGYMSGGHSARWKDEEFPDILTKKAKTFMEKNKDNPFFLYFAFHDIHVPRVPNPRFSGKSTMGPRGDAIAQMDWCTGQLIKKLEELGVADNTLIIFSSDNGPVLNDGYEDHAVELVGDHKPGGPFRGGKYSAFEAGTRVPIIIYWPGKVTPGVSGALLTQVDLYASLAHLVGQPLGPEDAPDSFDMLPAFLGKSQEGREVMLEEAFTYALRKNNWKYIETVEKDPPAWFANKDIESGLEKYDQLFNLKNDTGEQNNVAAENTDVLKDMKSILSQIKAKPSRPDYGK